MPEVVNPAIIIGLGGTGKWVLTYVKKNLLDIYGGEMPKSVRLLSFDTTSEKISREGGAAPEDDARVGDVQLDKQSEFVYLGGNIQQICREIQDQGKHQHIRSWLQARTYLQTADSDAFDISRGAGQKRPFGRMAVFYDLQQAVQSKISNKIETALGEVVDANNRQEPVEIYIVASLAGGTGSGMVIDIAHLTRWFASRQIRTGFAIRGFLALHNTFRSVIKTEHVQPQVFAALRELDRFMLVFNQRYPIVYNPNNQALQTIYGGQLGKLFDNCYLLDATREHLPLDGFEPKYGMYPSIADAVTMLLDGGTGDAYAQHYKNVNTRIADVQSKIKQPIYSSVGAYSLVLPVEDILTSLSYRFAIDLLGRHLLNLERQTNENGQTNFVLNFDSDPVKDAATFLRSPRNPSGVVSTNFIQRTAIVVESWRNRADKLVNDLASIETAELLTWMLPPETDPAIDELARKIRADLETTLSDRVRPSSVEGDDPVDGSVRIQRGVRDFRTEHLGHDVDGRRVGGLYRTAIEQCVAIHRDRYRLLLREHLLGLLNGPDPTNKDYQHEKRGKLGQAQALLTHLARYFSDLNSLISKVKDQRAARDELRSAQEEASLARLEMETKRDKRGSLGLLLRDRQPAIQAQRAYIDAERHAIDIEVKDLFFDVIQLTSDILRAVTEEHKAAIDSWIATLMRGLTGSLSDPGLYAHLRNGAARHSAHRDEKRRIVVHEYLTDPTYEDRLYYSVTQGKFAEALTRLVWEAEPRRDSFQLGLSGCAQVTALLDGHGATERNAKYLLGIAREHCAPLRELTIADRLIEFDVNQLAQMLLDRCGPLIRYDAAKAGGEHELRYFICVHEGRQQAFFNEFRAALKRLGTSARDNQILHSTNPYTCTILATADVIASPGLHAYSAAEREYNSYPGDARLLHCFPAEVNAVQLEQNLPRIREPRRRFSPVLTAMLEDRK
ncbi:MAG TPA: tubulin-like doman-containing protein, partial [Roseiflexaceae bacterium]|nr:tubulin-like doman-containing protein [Roseiflexaceae bacterium]